MPVAAARLGRHCSNRTSCPSPYRTAEHSTKHVTTTAACNGQHTRQPSHRVSSFVRQRPSPITSKHNCNNNNTYDFGTQMLSRHVLCLYCCFSRIVSKIRATLEGRTATPVSRTYACITTFLSCRDRPTCPQTKVSKRVFSTAASAIYRSLPVVNDRSGSDRDSPQARAQKESQIMYNARARRPVPCV